MSAQASFLALRDALSLREREFLASRNLAPLTRQAYLRDLDELAEFLADRVGIRDASRVSRDWAVRRQWVRCRVRGQRAAVAACRALLAGC